jgi:hypothetical protein
MRAFLVIALSMTTAGIAQTVSSDVQHLTVMVQGCPDQNATAGTGFIIGEEHVSATRHLFVITASHVVGPVNQEPKVVVKLDRSNALSCSVAASGYLDKDKDETTDIALLDCNAANYSKGLAYDVLEKTSDLKSRVPVILIQNPNDSDCGVAPSHNGGPFPAYFLFERLDGCVSQSCPSQQSAAYKNVASLIWLYNPLRVHVQGSSGGPALSERSGLVGMVVEDGLSGVKVLTWAAIQTWLRSQKTSPQIIRLHQRAHSAGLLRRTNVELSVTASGLNVPNIGWLSSAPQFRIGTGLPGIPQLDVAFDYTSAQASDVNLGGIKSINFSIPSVTADVRIGSLWSPLRRSEILGGLYVGAGAASISVQKTLVAQGSTSTLRTWSGVFDVGWRYRFAGRPWGITASYREGLLYGGGDPQQQQLYPRFRAVSSGLFVVFR